MSYEEILSSSSYTMWQRTGIAVRRHCDRHKLPVADHHHYIYHMYIYRAAGGGAGQGGAGTGDVIKHDYRTLLDNASSSSRRGNGGSGGERHRKLENSRLRDSRRDVIERQIVLMKCR